MRKTKLMELIEKSKIIEAFELIKKITSTIEERTALAKAAIKTKKYGIAIAVIEMGVEKIVEIKDFEKEWAGKIKKSKK